MRRICNCRRHFLRIFNRALIDGYVLKSHFLFEER